MEFIYWFLIAGALFLTMALSTTLLQRLPLTTSILYLGIGFALGPSLLGLIRLDPLRDAKLLEHVTEVAVVISLFTAGLKLRAPLRDALWRLPLRLAFGSMTLTVLLLAGIGHFLLHLSPGAAIILGAVLAPTDPVLASDVQVAHPQDRDRLRFALTGEAGLNDGTAFPFVMLGLGLLGAPEVDGAHFSWLRWIGVDVGYKTLAGLAIGAALGTLIGQLVLFLRREHQEAVGLDDFLALGLIALSYGLALWIDAYGFLAVFAAGFALRRVERQAGGKADEDAASQPDEVPHEASSAAPSSDETAVHPEHAPAFMAGRVLEFNEQLERIGEVAVVLLLGGMLATRALPLEAVWFAALLFVVVRPIAVWAGMLSARVSRVQKHLLMWFGVRGVGSLYYLMFAITHGLPRETSERLIALSFVTVAASIVLHGVSVTPLMNFYENRHQRRAAPTS